MKKFKNLFYLLSIILISNYSSAQKVGETVRLISHLKVKSFDNIIGENKDSVQYLEPYLLYNINKVDSTKIYLKALHFKNDSTKQVHYNDKIYTVARNEFNESHEEYKHDDKLSIGILTLPFKARPQGDFTFDTNFNLSTTLNWSLIRVYRAKLNVQIGSGIGNVNLNSSNASGISDDKAQTISSLNFFTGIMLEYHRVNAGMYVGVDHINNQSEYRWESNGNIWFGMGIGYDIFKISLGTKKNQ
ncbi:hypothetical protein NMK71_06565 [Weeksellaceae bacterium KMM 9713]|uniref:Outer membrane protein beta-barrel domain-containing protein n=1 Tax=Profundicola chukchiensis TaxID=2961959 RepID=A0A9X4MWB7_9FLAO|nr:hypothetical protein [Profundicola chukchiensis]MDG4946071.1 hypothetical protein [Profundicola chukchiensis]